MIIAVFQIKIVFEKGKNNQIDIASLEHIAFGAN